MNIVKLKISNIQYKLNFFKSLKFYEDVTIYSLIWPFKLQEFNFFGRSGVQKKHKVKVK